MPRKPRLHVPGQINHIIIRGNRHQDIFEHPSQWGDFLNSLSENAKEAGLTLYAYCLEPNHGHLMARIGEIPLGVVMQKTLTRFAIRSNLLNARSGHLFQGRHKALPVEDDAYAKVLLRYIHRNPIKDGLVKGLDDWRWSSHRAYAGLSSDPYVDTTFMLSLFSEDTNVARTRYLEFMQQESNGPSASPKSSLDSIARTVCRQEGIQIEVLLSGCKRQDVVRVRFRFIRLAISGGFEAREVADYLGVDRSSVFRAQRA